MFNRLFITVVAFTIFLAGCQVAPTTTDDSGQATTDTRVSIEVTDPNETAEEGDTAPEADGAETMEAELDEVEVSIKEDEDSPVADVAGSAVYEDYSASRYQELKGSKPVVLFFHADWCPTCRQMEKDINATLADFPDGTVILKTNYDTESTLKDEYDIKVQSTVIVLDASGEVIYTAQDPALEDFQAAIAKSLEV